MNTLLLVSLVVVLSAGLAWQNATLLTAVETQQRSLNQLLREGTNTPKSDTKPQSDEVSRLKRELAQAQHGLAQAQAQAKAQASSTPSCPPPAKPREPTDELKGLCREILEEAHSVRIVSRYSHQTNVWDVSEEYFRALQAECNEVLFG
jgi:hypothetical protein